MFVRGTGTLEYFQNDSSLGPGVQTLAVIGPVGPRLSGPANESGTEITSLTSKDT